MSATVPYSVRRAPVVFPDSTPRRPRVAAIANPGLDDVLQAAQEAFAHMRHTYPADGERWTNLLLAAVRLADREAPPPGFHVRGSAVALGTRWVHPDARLGRAVALACAVLTAGTANVGDHRFGTPNAARKSLRTLARWFYDRDDHQRARLVKAIVVTGDGSARTG